MQIRFRDPVSGFSHFAGALLGLAALVYLFDKSIGRAPTGHVVAYIVFGISLVLLYGASALYHLINLPDEERVIFRRLDHTMIYVLIAGSYTPFCYIALGPPLGWWILGAVWALALAGLFLSIFWLHAPRWLSTSIYLGMGWMIVAAIFPLMKALGPAGFFWLVAGGVAYSVGAVVYAVKRPNPFPPHFGFHEIWHLFVLAGSVCHFVSVTTLLS